MSEVRVIGRTSVMYFAYITPPWFLSLGLTPSRSIDGYTGAISFIVVIRLHMCFVTFLVVFFHVHSAVSDFFNTAFGFLLVFEIRTSNITGRFLSLLTVVKNELISSA
jgi:hypothetical protein